MSASHKAALAQGRREGHTVRRYLEALEEHRPTRGRKRTPETIARRLAAVKARLEDAEPLTRLHLLQEKADLERALARTKTARQVAPLEKAFVKVARAYGERKGIEYDAWRAAGVSAAVLRRAGITRTRASAPPLTRP
jgi:hypothetical protein